MKKINTNMNYSKNINDIWTARWNDRYSKDDFPAHIKSLYHKTFEKYLKNDGIIIFESFSKKHIDYVTANEKVGGPKDIESLFSIEEIKSDFPNYEIIELVEKEIELNEGLHHNGTGSVIRFMGRKKTRQTT